MNFELNSGKVEKHSICDHLTFDVLSSSQVYLSVYNTFHFILFGALQSLQRGDHLTSWKCPGYDVCMLEFARVVVRMRHTEGEGGLEEDCFC